MTADTQLWLQGHILWYNLGKGFGLIRPEDSNADDVRFEPSVFINQNIELLEPNTPVEYQVEQNLIGMCATTFRTI